MFHRITAALFYAVFALAVFAAATPAHEKRWEVGTTTVTVTAPAPTQTSVSQCNTGSINCCNSVESASDPTSSFLLGLLGIVLSGVDALVGIDCSPITLIGVAQGQCSSNPVCCSNNAWGGLISIGCIPIIL